MDAVEELMAQRDAVLFGAWVRGNPVMDGQACLVLRDAPRATRTELSIVPLRYLESAIRNQWGIPRTPPTVWNDIYCPNKQAALDVLDEAIRLAKEDM